MPPLPLSPTLVLTIALVAVATAWDLRTRRIPNWLTVPLAAAGLLLHAAANGPAGAGFSALGCLAGLVILLIPCFLRWVGAGDVKLLAAIGALQGPALVLRAGLYGILAGGLLSLGVLLVSRLAARASTSSQPLRRVTLPYGPALAVGTLAALALR
jgi:prepilin peptidase CpaA